MKRIAVFNKKGGVGKTTCTRNMAFVLAHHYKKKVLVVDCDSSANLSDFFHLKFDVSSDNITLSNLMVDDETDVHDAIYHAETAGIDVIPCNNTLVAAAKNVLLDSLTPQQFHLAMYMNKLQDEYDYVIFDCPPKDDIMVVNVLACANEVLIPVFINQDALAGAVDVVNLVDRISRYNPALTVRGALLTKISRNSLDQQGVSMDFGYPKFKTYIHGSVEVEKGRCEGKSCWEFHKGGAPAIDYDNFVAEYLGLPAPHPEISYESSSEE